MSVTTALNGLPKDALVQWSANMAADEAIALFEQNPLVDDPSVWRDQIRYAHRKRKEGAADLGTEVHGLAERHLLGETINLKELDKEVAKRFKHFLTFRSLYDIEPLFVEATVYNDTYRYAGSCDLMAVVDGVPTIVDLKTSKGIYGAVALQLSAYRFADVIVTDEGDELPLPSFDRGAVLHIRETGFSFREVDVSRATFGNFLNVLKTKRDWLDSAEKTALLPPIDPTPEALFKYRMGTN